MKKLTSLATVVLCFQCLAFGQVSEVVKPPVTRQSKLQNLQDIGQRLSSFKDEKISSYAMAQMADLAWKDYPEHSRNIFNQSLSKVAIKQNDVKAEAYSKRQVIRKIVGLIAKHDKPWAKQLIDSLTDDQGERDRAKMATADDLLETDQKAALDLANEAIKNEDVFGVRNFLYNMGKMDRAAADNFFLQLVRSYGRYSQVDIDRYGMLGTYLFTAPQYAPDDYESTAITLVVGAQIGFPNLTVTRPTAKPHLIEAYVRTAISLILRPTTDPLQAKQKYALGFLMMPKAKDVSTNLYAELIAANSTLLRSVPPAMTGDGAFKNMNPPPPLPPEDRIKEIEKNGDSYTRDTLYVDMAFWAWKRKTLLQHGSRQRKLVTTKCKPTWKWSLHLVK